MSRIFLTVILLGLLVGCGSSRATSATGNTYHDKKYGFSFRYPSGWTAPAQGKVQNVAGVSTYIVTLHPPDNSVGFEITADHDVIPFPTFQEGHIAPNPGGGPDMLHFHHARLSGWPAMEIQRYNGPNVDEIDTIINTRTISYQVRILTANPPLSATQNAAYNQVLNSLKIPFS